jgi:predicted alpha-1,6-mannanase (GH76 family)
MFMKNRWLIILLILSGTISSCSDKSIYDKYNGSTSLTQNLVVKWDTIANKSSQALCQHFLPNGTPYFGSEIWWNLKSSDPTVQKQENFTQGTMSLWSQSQAIDVMIAAYKRSKDQKFLDEANIAVSGIYQANGSFVNSSFRDSECMINTLLDLYDVVSDKSAKDKYWEAATSFYKQLEIATVVNDSRSKSTYTNGLDGIPVSSSNTMTLSTLSNAPAVIMAVKMYKIAKERNESADNYLQFAQNVYSYCSGNLFENGGLVYNSISNNNIDNTFYTSNEGYMIGAAVALYNITKDSTKISSACSFANYVSKGIYTGRPVWDTQYPVLLPDINSNTLVGSVDRSILMYRGIFFRYLVDLIDVTNTNISADKKELYKLTLTNNAETLWTYGQIPGKALWGSQWYEPPYKGEYVSTTSLSDPYISKEVIPLESQIAGAFLFEMKALLN